MSRWFLNGWFKAGCHMATAFSSHHKMANGTCLWCGKTEAELVALGAVWIDILGNQRPAVQP